MSQLLKLDLALIALFTGWAEYGNYVVVGLICGLLSVIIAAFCMIGEPDVIKVDVWEVEE